MIKFKDISHAYGQTPSIYDIDLEVPHGQVVSLLGPSGCGKSTILRLAAGLESPLKGEIYLDDRLIASPNLHTRPEDRGIGFVFQDYALFPHMSVTDNIIYSLKGQNRLDMSASMLEGKVKDALNHVDLADYADAMPHELSGGQQQRVALARALAPEPKLILLDEPYSGLDSRLRERIRDDMLHILKELEASVLMVTHDSEEAMFMSDHILVMRDGRIEQTGRPIDLYCRPKNAFVAEFFGEVNRFDGMIIGNTFTTPFGNYQFRNAKDGDDASMVIRHEGLVVRNDGEPNAEIVETRLLGRYTFIHLSMTLKNGEDLHLHARIPGLNMFAPGDRVSLTIDESQTFIFPTP